MTARFAHAQATAHGYQVLDLYCEEERELAGAALDVLRDVLPGARVGIDTIDHHDRGAVWLTHIVGAWLPTGPVPEIFTALAEQVFADNHTLLRDDRLAVVARLAARFAHAQAGA